MQVEWFRCRTIHPISLSLYQFIYARSYVLCLNVDVAEVCYASVATFSKKYHTQTST